MVRWDWAVWGGSASCPEMGWSAGVHGLTIDDLLLHSVQLPNYLLQDFLWGTVVRPGGSPPQPPIY